MKSADAFRTISEVSQWLATPAHVLRFWESKFAQIKPVKRAGGRRYYRPDDMALLGGIKVLLHEQGMTIKGVQKLLREKGTRAVAGLSPLVPDGPGAEDLVLEVGEDVTILTGPEFTPNTEPAPTIEAIPAQAAILAAPSGGGSLSQAVRPLRARSPLSLIRSADAARARTNARRIAPLIMQLKSLALRMAQD